jgi:tRNA A-37 threonylcarbamoyl transferase component Bud32
LENKKMAYCYECGEQVAENDVFCPYCGISLSPIPVAGEDDDDAMSKTIAISQPVTTKAATTAAATPFAETENSKPQPPSAKTNQAESLKISPEKTPAEQEVPEQKTDDFSADITAENLYMKTDTVDVPAEAIKNAEDELIDDDELREMEVLFAGQANEQANGKDSSKEPEPAKNADFQPAKNLQTLNPLVGSFAVKPESNEDENSDLSTEQDSIDSFSEVDSEPVFVSDAEDNAAKSGDVGENPQTESTLMSYEEADVKDVLSADEPEKSVDDAAVSENADDFFSPEPPLSLPVNLNALDSPFDVSGVPANENKTPEMPQIRERLAGELITNKTPAAFDEKPIQMPETDLPVEEVKPADSRFDSVSIMEKPENDDGATERTSSATSGEEKAAPENEERAFTQPNMGGNDTGGRNKTKLKPLDEGTVLNNRYEIVRKIGGGGMGAVYLASDKNLGGVLRAVKEMVQSYIEDAQQEKAVNDFKRESLLLTSLDHQSIPTIYDYFFDEKEARFYLVMKYISGGDLSSRLRSAPEGRINETDVAKWALQIADVLDYLHNRQPPIVYRDLKPANIMVDGNSGRVMLIDFGIARWVNKEEKGVTAVGTMGYAPPELFSGNVEPRSDIYSLGSTMFHLLTGADPQSNPLLIFDFQKHPRPRQINPQLSDQMERILMRAVEYNADKRFASAAEMRQALEEHLDNLKAGRVTFGIKEAPASVALSDQPVFCGFCGQKIVATDMFCAFCGAKQPLAQQGVHSHAEGYSPSPLTAQLLIVGTSVGAIRCQIYFPKLICRNTIRKRKFLADTRASGARAASLWSKIWARQTARIFCRSSAIRCACSRTSRSL